MDKNAAIVQPIGHAHQMPVDCKGVSDNRNANTTRSIKSTKVAIINCFIRLAPRKIPSATSFADTTK